jgi:hypothetical protein
VRIVTEKEAQETPREKGSGLPVPGKERLDTLRDGRGTDTYRELPVEQRSVAPPPRVMKKAARKSMAEEGVVSFAAPPDKVRGKSLPGPLAKDDIILGLIGDDSPARENTAALSEEAMRGTRTDVTEVLTVVSLDEGEVDDLRERLRRAGGRLLEMRTLDAFATQQLAQPYQEKIPPSQIVSRGWQIRAAVPRSSVEDFIASFAGKSSLQLLHRATEPLSWSQERGHQNFEINLIR